MQENGLNFPCNSIDIAPLSIAYFSSENRKGLALAIANFLQLPL